MLEDIEKYFTENNIPKFRIQQLKKAVFEDLVDSFDDITVFPKDLREKLSSNFSLKFLDLVNVEESKDTKKFLFKTKDGHNIESVLMLHEDGRRTVCVSCQIFCALGCKFCATGANPFVRSLTEEEIISQILEIKKNEKVTNVVYMGMGEPFLNYDNVIKSINTLNKEIGIGARHIIVSTAGIAPRIYDFADLGLQVRLAVSLHAPNDELRSLLMPINDKYNIEEIFKATDYFTEKTNKKVSYEYVLIKGINDSEKEANELAELLKGRLAYVNILVYNPHKFANFERPNKETVSNFKKILEDNGIDCSIRKSLGDEISSACGQLSAETKT